MVKFKYDIRTIKWTKERNLQVSLIWSFNEITFPFGFFPFIFLCEITSIYYS